MVNLITQRSVVQIHPPQPTFSISCRNSQLQGLAPAALTVDVCAEEIAIRTEKARVSWVITSVIK